MTTQPAVLRSNMHHPSSCAIGYQLTVTSRPSSLNATCDYGSNLIGQLLNGNRLGQLPSVK